MEVEVVVEAGQGRPVGGAVENVHPAAVVLHAAEARGKLPAVERPDGHLARSVAARSRVRQAFRPDCGQHARSRTHRLVWKQTARRGIDHTDETAVGDHHDPRRQRLEDRRKAQFRQFAAFALDREGVIERGGERDEVAVANDLPGVTRETAAAQVGHQQGAAQALDVVTQGAQQDDSAPHAADGGGRAEADRRNPGEIAAAQGKRHRHTPQRPRPRGSRRPRTTEGGRANGYASGRAGSSAGRRGGRA